VASSALPGKTERRLALAILVTALVPLAAAIFLSQSLFSQASAIWFNPEVGEQLDRGVDLYRDYVAIVKEDLRLQGDLLAADAKLRTAAARGDRAATGARLEQLFATHPALVSVRIEDPEGNVIATHDRGRPLDDAKEKKLDVVRPLADEGGATLTATFAADRRHIDELETSGSVVTRYHQLEHSRSELYDGYVRAFIVLLIITMFVALLSGTMLARGVTRRINRLAAAIDVVTKGDDLSVRVPVTGSDELTDLASTFNRMLSEMATSRSRIEYLQRIGAWQEMAQRLAHEIKNPLTPIQLAVQECHEKYGGDDPKYRALLDTTLEIVQEEVGVLRRLVGDFSSFARLPHAELEDCDLREFLSDCKEQLGHLQDATFAPDAIDGDVPASTEEAPADAPKVDVTWELPAREIPVAIDRQMLRRVLVNLVRNSVQAIRDARGAGAAPNATIGNVRVHAEVDDVGDLALFVDDDGPGIAADLRERIFEPYFTTKQDGTGLGLAIVKKIVVEHGGTITIADAPSLPGARIAIRLPRRGLGRLDPQAGVRAARERARAEGVATS
jgi:nitrogen fixation/metabolism regulation signal transduction histidine kinase